MERSVCAAALSLALLVTMPVHAVDVEAKLVIDQVTVYPEPVQWVIQALPLWHGVELVRGLTTGVLGPAMLVHLLYYLVMVILGLAFTTRRLRALFLD